MIEGEKGNLGKDTGYGDRCDGLEGQCGAGNRVMDLERQRLKVKQLIVLFFTYQPTC